MADKAINLYTSLKMFKEANELMKKHGGGRTAEERSLAPDILVK